MISYKPIHSVLLLHLLVGTLFGGVHQEAYAQNAQTASISVNATGGRPIPQDFFGIFFEEINHAGAGGLWSELVSNRGFERGGKHSPSMITPWGRVGDEVSISINTELVSCFKSNAVALRMDVLCDGNCPLGGVGVFNPGYWGMNIEQGKSYKLIFYTKATGPLELTASFNTPDGSQVLASGNIVADAAKVKDWSKMELTLEAKGSDPKARLQLTTNKKRTIWLDQVSAMPTDTFKGHGFRKDMAQMLVDLKPRFLRFPGGCFVEGEWLRHAFRWKETIGPWEERPGHMGDVWKYWSDDGLGYLEYLQLAEDLGAEPVWVINNGISHREEVDTTLIAPFVQEMLDSIEFAIGSPNSTWGSLRAKYGHPQPFSLKYVAIGNEDCGKKNYKGNYMKFYEALKRVYPDIKSISNCDGSSSQPLDHPTDLYDYHNYTTAEGMLDIHNILEKKPRDGPKAFVSEYAVTEPHDKIGNGTFKGALGEAAFLISLEKISDIVSMVSYAPLFAHENDIYWSPDAVFFNSNQLYAIGSYWVQTFFSDSSGATLLDATMQSDSNPPIYYSAISFKDPLDQKNYIRIKVVNFQDKGASLKISLNGVDAGDVQGARKTVFASTDLWGENSFANPKKMAPQTSPLQASGKDLDVQVDPYSLTSFDLLSSGGGGGGTTTTGTAQPKISQPNAANSGQRPTLTKV